MSVHPHQACHFSQLCTTDLTIDGTSDKARLLSWFGKVDLGKWRKVHLFDM